MLAMDISDKDGDKLLLKILKEWVAMRGHSMGKRMKTIKLLQKHLLRKEASEKTHAGDDGEESKS